jgi:hypothetical protein
VLISSNNGNNWISVNDGLAIAYAPYLVSIGSELYATVSYFSSGLFRTNNGGFTWSPANNGLQGNEITSSANIGTTLFAAAYNGGGVFQSNDNGNTWTASNTGLTSLDVNSLAISGTNIFASTFSGGVFLSTNNGNSWTAVNTFLTNTQVISLTTNGINIFAGTTGGIFLSTNNGSTWTRMYIGLPSGAIRQLVSSGTNIFAVLDGASTQEIYLSADTGNTWTSVSSGLPIHYSCKALVHSGAELFTAYTPAGVFLSTDNGSSWSAVNTGLVSPHVRSLAINNNLLYASLFGAGVWKRPLSEITTINGIQKESFISIAPNPFTSQTTISFNEEQRNTTIKIMDVLGNCIQQQIANGSTGSPTRQLTLDMSGVAKGIYFVQVMLENKNVINKKIIIN